MREEIIRELEELSKELLTRKQPNRNFTLIELDLSFSLSMLSLTSIEYRKGNFEKLKEEIIKGRNSILSQKRNHEAPERYCHLGFPSRIVIYEKNKKAIIYAVEFYNSYIEILRKESTLNNLERIN